jgi:hypothetical protein
MPQARRCSPRLGTAIPISAGSGDERSHAKRSIVAFVEEQGQALTPACTRITELGAADHRQQVARGRSGEHTRLVKESWECTVEERPRHRLTPLYAGVSDGQRCGAENAVTLGSVEQSTVWLTGERCSERVTGLLRFWVVSEH